MQIRVEAPHRHQASRVSCQLHTLRQSARSSKTSPTSPLTSWMTPQQVQRSATCTMRRCIARQRRPPSSWQARACGRQQRRFRTTSRRGPTPSSPSTLLSPRPPLTSRHSQVRPLPAPHLNNHSDRTCLETQLHSHLHTLQTGRREKHAQSHSTASSTPHSLPIPEVARSADSVCKRAEACFRTSVLPHACMVCSCTRPSVAVRRCRHTHATRVATFAACQWLRRRRSGGRAPPSRSADTSAPTWGSTIILLPHAALRQGMGAAVMCGCGSARVHPRVLTSSLTDVQGS